MPILPNAKKALRVSKRKTQVNQKIKSRVRSAAKNISDQTEQANLQVAYSIIDKAVKKNIFHKNKAARLKSKLAKLAKLEKATQKSKKATIPKAVKKTSSKTSSTKKTAKK